MAKLIGGDETRSLRDVGTLTMLRIERDLLAAVAGDVDARRRLPGLGLWWPLSSDDLQWLAEREAERARRRHEDDLAAGLVTDFCPPPGPVCELCSGREELSRSVAEWHAFGTTQGPFCYVTCRDCVAAERGPYFDLLAWFSDDGYRRRVAAHAEHMGWRADDEEEPCSRMRS